MSKRRISIPVLVVLGLGIISPLLPLSGVEAVGVSGSRWADNSKPGRPAALEPSRLLQDPSETPTPTPTPVPGSQRPLLVLESYSVQGGQPTPGKEFNLIFRLANVGASKARNIVVTFASGDFLPRVNGGVLSAGVIAGGASTGYTQPLTASSGLQAGSVGLLPAQVSYSDDDGNSYSESFSITLALDSPQTGPSRPVAPTPTPPYRPQLLIIGYTVDKDPLTPGARFALTLELHNVGGSAAKRVTMILGGGSSAPSGGDGAGGEGTGTSGSGGDFSKIAPNGSSNVRFVGDVATGETIEIKQPLIVNSGTDPGVYPLPISLTYIDDKGKSYNDDQVVTLLVYAPPILEINFYRPPDPFFAGQPGMLPVQVVNLSPFSVVLGKMVIRADGLLVENSTAMIGYLDTGGYYPIDAMVFPEEAGQLAVEVEVNYLDDFHQAQIVRETLIVDVMEGQPFDPGMMEDPSLIPPEESSESFWQKLWRFLRGLIGLDSGVVVDDQGMAPPVLEALP